MKPVLGIALMLVSMLAEGDVMITLMFAVWLAVPLFDWFSLRRREQSSSLIGGARTRSSHAAG